MHDAKLQYMQMDAKLTANNIHRYTNFKMHKHNITPMCAVFLELRKKTENIGTEKFEDSDIFY